MLTRKQHELIRFIQNRLEESGVSPSFEEMKEALDLKSKSGVHRLISALEERGFIRRLPNRARALEVLRQPEDVSTRPAPRAARGLARTSRLPMLPVSHAWPCCLDPTLGSPFGVRAKQAGEVAAAGRGAAADARVLQVPQLQLKLVCLHQPSSAAQRRGRRLQRRRRRQEQRRARGGEGGHGRRCGWRGRQDGRAGSTWVADPPTHPARHGAAAALSPATQQRLRTQGSNAAALPAHLGAAGATAAAGSAASCCGPAWATRPGGCRSCWLSRRSLPRCWP